MKFVHPWILLGGRLLVYILFGIITPMMFCISVWLLIYVSVLSNINACKTRQIQEYFQTHEKLGYSILVQSPLSQPIVHRNESRYRKFLDAPKGMPIPNYAGEEGLEHIRQAEGQLIESYRLCPGDIPPWNMYPLANMLPRVTIFML